MVARSVFALYVLALFLVVFLPAEDAIQVTGFVAVIAGFLSSLGLPRQPSEVVVEFLSNIVLFVPWGLFVRLLSPTRFPAWAVVLSGAGLSLAIELIQILVPGRVTALSDVIANTLGTAVGLLLLKIVAPSALRLMGRGAA